METVTQSIAPIVVLVARKPGLSFEEFKSYYEDRHIPWVTPLVFSGENSPIIYTRNYLDRDGETASSPVEGAGSFGFDCVTHVVFRDAQQRAACLEHFKKYEDEIAKDEEKFLDRSATRIMFVKETVASETK